ncbi:phosphoenolpyruvate carboxykinase (ATP) [candidate division WOR-3 bacterium JGI_Cruoil_03_51_56]|uniref:Phosphoenolpyruvate carboxykinase (ATP) n=1 Tax=candidate division WOR-3 bacterium JGI_Cruoil_03_51_56 TaxID=1973747 RepID=A0A235BU98_UNCW3|nr:MAG: phosphoenolpyruvate carboxykinase (ATP) [candidate division WOR-3 bacterium JGI_Cruoil_03_51_56]
MNHNLETLLKQHRDVKVNPPRQLLIQDSVDRKEAFAAECGCLVTWTPVESTGRSPKDTVITKWPRSEGTIDWDSPNNIPIEPRVFDMVFEDALKVLGQKERLYVTDRVLGADPAYALPVRTVTDKALSALFTDNMFRPVPKDIGRSCFAKKPFTLLVLPYDKLDPNRYKELLRVDPRLGRTSTMLIGMDMDRCLGVVYGSAYGGSVKKLMFTVMNYLLPGEGVLPLHSSANEGPEGDVALLLGLSGTGKTTLSADPRRALLGDDEHAWSDDGVANLENGCYAKLIDLDPNKEPEIYNACFHKAQFLKHGAIIENTMFYPDGTFDLNDDRLTPNSRGSYPLSFLKNIKTPPVAGHAKTVLFLTADANGVLPPVARLTSAQAMLWFLLGYTSKLAGTETGITEPVSTFSRFFGQPFMPRNPDVYARMLGDKLRTHGAKVYLVNTGWTGGPYGIGKRISLTLTREMVEAALSGALANVECWEDKVFHLHVPKTCPGVPDPNVLNPRNTWKDKNAYDSRARRLADEFAAQFLKAYENKGIDPAVARECPGR